MQTQFVRTSSRLEGPVWVSKRPWHRTWYRRAREQTFLATIIMIQHDSFTKDDHPRPCEHESRGNLVKSLKVVTRITYQLKAEFYSPPESTVCENCSGSVNIRDSCKTGMGKRTGAWSSSSAISRTIVDIMP